MSEFVHPIECECKTCLKRRFRQRMHRTTEFRTMQQLAGRMHRNGATQSEIEFQTGRKAQK